MRFTVADPNAFSVWTPQLGDTVAPRGVNPGALGQETFAKPSAYPLTEKLPGLSREFKLKLNSSTPYS